MNPSWTSSPVAAKLAEIEDSKPFRNQILKYLLTSGTLNHLQLRYLTVAQAIQTLQEALDSGTATSDVETDLKIWIEHLNLTADKMELVFKSLSPRNLNPYQPLTKHSFLRWAKKVLPPKRIRAPRRASLV